MDRFENCVKLTNGSADDVDKARFVIVCIFNGFQLGSFGLAGYIHRILQQAKAFIICDTTHFGEYYVPATRLGNVTTTIQMLNTFESLGLRYPSTNNVVLSNADLYNSQIAQRSKIQLLKQ